MLGSLQFVWHQGGEQENGRKAPLFLCSPFQEFKTSGMFCYLCSPGLTTPVGGFAHCWSTFPPILALAGPNTSGTGCSLWSVGYELTPRSSSRLSWGRCEFVRFDFAPSSSQNNRICLETQGCLLIQRTLRGQALL